MKDFLKETILEAGELAKDYFEKGVSFEVKSHLADLLTEADIKTSEFLVNAIHKEYPDHGITSEELEESINPGAEYGWDKKFCSRYTNVVHYYCVCAKW